MLEFLTAAFGSTWLEWSSLALTIAFLLLIGRGNVLGWPIGILACVGYGIVFQRAGLYADATLQGIFGIQLAYGWALWRRGEQEGSALVVSRIPGKRLLALLALGAPIALAYGAVLSHFFAPAYPWADAALATASVVAQWMQARKYIENWPAWLVINAGYLWLYWLKDLHPTMLLTLILMVLAVRGWYLWGKPLER